MAHAASSLAISLKLPKPDPQQVKCMQQARNSPRDSRPDTRSTQRAGSQGPRNRKEAPPSLPPLLPDTRPGHSLGLEFLLLDFSSTGLS